MAQLYKSGGALRCSKAHSFDISREGYVNLLPVHRRRSREPGDDAGMIGARRRFLQDGHYDPLVTALSMAIASRSKTGKLVDLGCGEGFFTNVFANDVSQVYGIDVSKPAIKAACKSYKSLCLAVANTTKLPLLDNAFEIATLVLAPFSDDIVRVVETGGTVLRVSPGSNHLCELKRIVYRNFSPHKRAVLELPQLKHIRQTRIEFDLNLDQQNRIDLIDMTPMRYRIEPVLKSQANGSHRLTVTADFWIDTFEVV
jgi:23S rRNA (guanine745-N1)-methyltransferase